MHRSNLSWKIHLLAMMGIVCNTPPATAKTFVDYFQPTPTACPVTSQAWGASGVLPRDTCNGLESTKTPPQYYYWDGKVLQAPDGKYHMFADRWLGSTGFGNWGNSQTVHAVSTGSVLGPYVDQGYAFDNGPDSGDRHKGHNVSACMLLDGTYCLYVNEVVPFTIFTSASLDGPWTPCKANGALIQTNGVTVNFAPGGDSHMDSNVSLVVRPDGNFEVIQRHGVIAISTTGICGPYKVQQPSNTYPSNQQPPSGLPSIYPNRQKHTADDSYAPSSIESTYVLAEDPVIWYSGGQYHVLYDYPDDRVGYHLTSTDGIHDWTDRGFAYDPRMSKQLFSTTDGTVNNWYKMERPGVIMANGHITHFTFAVSDVDKNNQIPANSNHGSKVLVMQFDGVGFDAETGVGGTGGAGGAGGSGAGGIRVDAGMRDDTGITGTGGTVASGGSSAAGGTTADSSAGGAMAGGGNHGSGGSASTGGSSTGNSGGAGTVTGGSSTGSGGSSSTTGSGGNGGPHGGATSQGGAPTANGGGSGCSCVVAGGWGTGNTHGGWIGTLLGFLAIAWRRNRPSRD